jgi:DNA polymerase
VKRLFLDFETYYAKGYTLRSAKMSMSEYIRHPEYKTHMLQWALNDEPVQWCSVESVQAVLDEFDWDQIELVAHNTAFDGFILSHHYGKVPARYSDTMLMSRALYGASVGHGLDELCTRLRLGSKITGALEDTKGKRDLTDDELQALADYGVQDVELMRSAYFLLEPKMPLEELDLIDITLAMFCAPVLEVDRQRVDDELEREVGSKVAKVLRAGVAVEELSSNDEFAEVLERLGVDVPKKISPRTGETTYAFSKKDQGFLALLKHPTQRVRDVMEARMAVKSTIGETRAHRFLNASVNGCKLPVLLQYCGAHTTRWSAGNKMNMQNLPRGGELRKSILAPKGKVIVVVDSSQIEARVNLWLAGDEEKLEIFRHYDWGTGPDLYKVMAAKIYDKPIADVTQDERQLGKVCVLALGYGMGAEKLQDTLATDKYNPMEFSSEECRRIVNIYRSANEPIVRLWGTMEKLCSFMILGHPIQYKALEFFRDRMQLPSGLSIHYKDLKGSWNDWTQRYIKCSYMSRRNRVDLYGGLLCENAVQALARVVVAEQMRQIAQRYRVVMMTHDEVVFLASEREADEALAWAIAIMKTPPTWAPDLPVNCEGGYASNYSK